MRLMVPTRHTLPLVILAVALAIVGCAKPEVASKLPAGATFELFVIVPAAGADTAEAIAPDTGALLFLQKPPVITTSDVATVRVVAEGENMRSIEVNLTPAGDATLSAAIGSTPSGRIAIVVNGLVVSTPDLLGPLGKSFRFTGDARTPAFSTAIRGLTSP